MARIFECDIYNLRDDLGYQAVATHLWSYKSARVGWDDYAAKIDHLIRDTMAHIFQDCRENGFYDPHCIMERGKKKIVFAQCVERERKVLLPDVLKPNLCYLCEKRTCDSRDIKGNYKQNKDHCWHNQIEA